MHLNKTRERQQASPWGRGGKTSRVLASLLKTFFPLLNKNTNLDLQSKIQFFSTTLRIYNKYLYLVKYGERGASTPAHPLHARAAPPWWFNIYHRNHVITHPTFEGWWIVYEDPVLTVVMVTKVEVEKAKERACMAWPGWATAMPLPPPLWSRESSTPQKGGQ